MSGRLPAEDVGGFLLVGAERACKKPDDGAVLFMMQGVGRAGTLQIGGRAAKRGVSNVSHLTDALL